VSNSEAQAKYHAKKTSEGWMRLNVWVPRDLKDEVKEHVEKFLKKRGY